MREVLPGRLWIGHEGDLADPARIFRQQVAAVLVVAPLQLPSDWPRDEILLRVPLHDDESNPPAQLRLARDCARALLDAGVPTLIACSAGMSRSIALAAAAIAAHSGRLPAEILREISVGRPTDVSPGLWTTLQSLERSSDRN